MHIPGIFPVAFNLHRAWRVALFALPSLFIAHAGEPKPVPRFQAIPLPSAQILFQRDGVELTRYHFGMELKRPFLFPVNGPSGRSVTRMGHPHDPEGHSHHNSVWISHQFVGGANFWGDSGGARVVHKRILMLDDAEDRSAVEVENEWRNAEGAVVARELRRIAVCQDAHMNWRIEIDMQLAPPANPKGAKDAPEPVLELGESAFGFIGVRMAKSIGVTDGGGTIRNSEGGVDEVACFRKPARWCDYSGPITPQTKEGILLMDHPKNPGHPVAFHVRNDGWMGATCTFSGARQVTIAEPLRLRYALLVHADAPAPETLEAAWRAFSITETQPYHLKK